MIKKYFLPIVLFIFTICLVVFSSSNLVAAKNGLNLWATSVIPSLFPFFVATELLSQTNMPYLLGKFFNAFVKPLFNIKGEGSFALIMGILSGYPVGAKIACNFRKNNTLCKVECERLLSFTNNSGPLFIIGTVGISMFGNSTIGFLLFITHLLACFTVGFLFRFWNGIKTNRNSNFRKTNINYITHTKRYFRGYESSASYESYSQSAITFSSLGSAIATAISNATSTILMIGGFVVMFSVIISILNASNLLTMLSSTFVPFFNFLHIPATFISPIITGLLEVTNGISLISNIHIKAISINIIITAFLLGLGGISIFLQVLSITSKTDLSIKPYIMGKLLHGIIAAFYTWAFIEMFPVFNFNL